MEKRKRRRRRGNKERRIKGNEEIGKGGIEESRGGKKDSIRKGNKEISNGWSEENRWAKKNSIRIWGIKEIGKILEKLIWRSLGRNIKGKGIRKTRKAEIEMCWVII